MITLQTLGPLRLTDASGKDCTPRGRKACGLLALLALSPGRRRARRWIQDKLWSDRGSEQGAASLRQSLAEIRRALGDDKKCLLTDHHSVGLSQERVQFDLDPGFGNACADTTTSQYDLLEGLKIRDPEFQIWLRDQRHQFEAECAKRKSVSDPDETEPVQTISNEGTQHNALLIVPGTQSADGAGKVVADGLLDNVAKTLMELAPIKVIDNRDETIETDEHAASPNEPLLSIRSDTATLNDQLIFRIVMKRSSDRRIVWSQAIQANGANGVELEDRETLRHINEIVSVAIDDYLRTTSGSSKPIAATLCYQGIRHLFRLGKVNFQTADSFFERAFEIEPRGIYLAWRAYQRTFMLAERQYDCRETAIAEALEFMHLALEAEPYNSFVASLSAHVYTIVTRSYVAAYELAERSVQLNRANPLGWMTLGIAKCHLGKANEGFRNTVWAREIAGAAPYRFHIDALCCIAGVMAGKFDDATRIAIAGHALAPKFAPPIRYLTALYLYADQTENSHAMVNKMQILEPDFSYQILADPSYPAAGLRQANLMKYLPGRQI